MKVQTIESTGFKPITLSITIESPEELEAVQQLTGLDVTVPSILVGEGYLKERDRFVVTNLFRGIFNEVANREAD